MYLSGGDFACKHRQNKAAGYQQSAKLVQCKSANNIEANDTKMKRDTHNQETNDNETICSPRKKCRNVHLGVHLQNQLSVCESKNQIFPP